MNSLVEVVFLLSTWSVKAVEICKTDTFNAIFGFMLSLAVSWMVLQIRIKEGQVKTKLMKMGTVDYLTGILNKTACEQGITEYLETREQQDNCALLVLDIDNFKNVNDRIGHKFGDIVLNRMGSLLQHTFRTGDIIGRFGGDEFLVLLKNVKDAEMLENRCNHIIEEFKSIKYEQNTEVDWKFSCSIGAVLLGEERLDFPQLFQMADDALYEAKSFGKGRCVVHSTKALERNAGRNMILIAEDSEVNRVALVSILADQFEIAEAADGNSTLSLLSQYNDQIAMVLLDLYMPGLNGYGVLNYMKSRTAYRSIPVIIVTADTDRASEEEALRQGAVDVIIKPIDPAVVRLRVKNALKYAGREL
ncbi:MAG: diguanylate cyclase [Lachnospiraceae bacterium]|nr:diguanylate cyclase [Lachnospiraceae bacterium]